MSTESGIEELKRLREEARLGGGAKRVEAQHARGKLTARERLALLLDEGTFQEVDPFIIPLITFIDSPGFLPGTAQEHGGIIRHGAKIVYVYSEATVPKISIVTRKAYGGAYIVMSSKCIRTDLCYAWPSAEIAVLGAEGAVNIIFRREIAAADDPEAERQRLVEEYRAKFAKPYAAASGHIDDVIAPRETRPRLVAALELLKDKQASLPLKKHGNMPV